ncbi:MAG: phospholipid carrier-dependent glycosyltransferase [Denitrovibrio sp.]|nr:MAG: phospholipid carrier-dependent glycosyltransferase [Denitrovibrio sp.]
MLNSKQFNIFLLIYFIFLLIPAYWLPLFESTDARYGEIAREMLSSGNFMEPYYNGIKHFHKPPFTYWANALGMAIFGVNGLGARFFGAVASIFILIYTRKTAYVLTKDDETADRAAFVLASSILFLIVSRIVATDIYLVLFTIMTLYHLFSQMYVRHKTSNAVLAGLFLGLGFMTKGPVVFLFTLLPFFTAKFFDHSHRRVFTYPQVFYGLLVFLLVSLPWYGYIISINDGLLSYFLKDQTVERVTTDRFDRSKPFYYFFMVFFVTFLPWIFYFLRNYRFSDKLQPGRALYLYILMPFIVFQIATSKLGTYILPFFPAAAVIVALNVDSRLIKKISVLIFLTLGAGVCAAPFLIEFLNPLKYFLVTFGILFFTTALFIFLKGWYDKYYVRSTVCLMLVFAMTAFCVLPFIAPYVKGYRLLTGDIKRYDPEGKYEVLVYKTFLPVISFYMNDVKPIAFSKERETQFQSESEYSDILIETDEQLKNFLKKHKELIIVVRNNTHETFEKQTGYKCEVISVRGGDKRAAHCKSPEIAD